MSGRNIGHVEFIVDFDGDHLPRQAREIGKKAGAEFGDGMSKGTDKSLTEFGTRLRKEMAKHGRDGGMSFTDAFESSINQNLDDTVREVSDVFNKRGGFEKFADSFDSIGDASDDLDRKLIRLNETGRLTDDQFLELIDTQSTFARSARESADENERLSKVVRGIELDRLSSQLDDVAEKRRIDTRLAGEQWRENQKLERVVNDIQYDRFLQELDLTETKQRRVSMANDQAAKFAAKEAAAVERAIGSHVKFNDESTKTERALARLGGALRNIDVKLPSFGHGMRQAAFYTGLFTALAPGIAVLGSVSGSGLLSLATGAGALGLGLAAVIPGFRGMLDDVEKLPPKARGAAKAMQAFGEPLSEMQDIIQGRMFDGLGDEIDDLREKTLPQLTRGMGKTATTVNGIFDDMLSRLTSKRGVSRLGSILDGLQPILEGLGGSVLNLGAAFSGVFEAALPSGQGFAEFLEDTTGDFNAWVNDTAGRDALREWFDHLGEVMPGVGRLIGAAGISVANLVTDKSVDNMTRFLDTMTEALPEVVGGLGGFIDAADPLGLAADAVAGIGDFFTKNASGMEKFGEAANGFVTDVGGELGGILGNIGEELLKISPDILDSVGSGLTSVGKAINSPEGKAAIESLGAALTSAGDAVGDLLTDLADSGAITDSLKAIGAAAEVAAKGIELFNDGNKAINGDLDIPGGKEGAEAIKNYQAGGKKAWDQGWKDFFSFDPKDGERLFRAWGLNGGLSAGDGAKDGIDKKKDEVKTKGAELGSSFADGVKGGDSKAKVVAAAGGLGGGFLTGLTDAFNKDTGTGNVLSGFVGRLFGDDTQDGKAQKTGAGLAEAFKLAVGTGLESIGDLAGGLGTALGELFGGKDDDAKTKGSETGKSFKDGVKEGATAGGLGDALDGLFDGDAGKEGAKGAGIAAKGSYVEGILSAGESGGIAGALGAMFQGNPGQAEAGAAGTAASEALVAPFITVPERVGANIAGTPGTIGGIMGAITGQPGADNTVNPFAAVPGRIGGNIAGTPGAVGGVMGQVSGQRGADNTANPFNSVTGRIQGAVDGTPGAVGGIMGAVDGTPGANNVVTPFSGVPGRVGTQVSGTPGAVSGQLDGINDFGAASRIIGAFQDVPGAVSRALSGLGSVVQTALAGARGALAGGLQSLRSSLPPTATGGMFNTAQARIIGEAGPEAVVPLNRPLARVDPAVRDLSAIAQGKTTTGSGTTYGTYIAEGAVSVTPQNSDPTLVAAATVDRIVAAAMG